MRAKERSLARICFPLNQRKREVAAEDDAAGAGEAIGQTLRDRADAGDRQHAERDAGDEDAEAAQSAAQLAPGKMQRQQEARFCGRRQHHCALGTMHAGYASFSAKGTRDAVCVMMLRRRWSGVRAGLNAYAGPDRSAPPARYRG